MTRKASAVSGVGSAATAGGRGYGVDRPEDNASRHLPPKPQASRRPSPEVWQAITSAVARERERIATVDPASPRIRPSLPPIRGASHDDGGGL
jgi:hypothetical protein